jgi:hypothetical protein
MPNVVYIERVNARPRPTKPAKMNYSLITPVIVLVIVALAEELLASVWPVVILLSGILASATEMLRSVRPNRISPANRIARIIKAVSPFTFPSDTSYEN